jgi:site-specific recombinase XerD
MTEIIPTSSGEITTGGGQPLDQNPAAVYLARLTSATSRRTQKQALDVMAGLMSGGAANCLAFPWHELRYQHTAALRAKLIDKYAAATCNKFLSALRGVLKEAWRLGLMSAEEYQRAADLASVTGSTIPAGRELQPGEITALMANCENDLTAAGARDAAIIALMYTGGLRREEVVSLDLENYEPETGKLVILGKRNKQRTAYLINGAAGAMADWLDVRGNEPGPLFFPVNKGGRVKRQRMSNQAIYNILAKRAELAGVKEFSPHDMRRTFVSDLLDAGADITTVAKIAGHSNVATTARYDRRGEQAKQKAAGLLHIAYRRRNKLGKNHENKTG